MAIQLRWVAVAAATVGLAVPYGCSASSNGDDSSGGAGGAGGAGGSAASGGTGAGGTGATGTGATGGGIAIDASTGGSGGGSGGITGDACAATSASADAPSPLPADIIWAVDQSGSMNQETAYVQGKINDFANLIAATNIDYRVVMIAATTGGNAICVPPPLSGGGCGDGPRFRLVNVKVDSNDALNKIVDNYSKYSDFLRQNAVKHFVVVTDDNATDSPLNSAQKFANALVQLQPAGMFAKWKFHSIFAYGSVPFFGCVGPFGTGAAIGVVYDQLVTQTGGAKGEICIDNWTPVFNAIQVAVVQGSKISCEYAVPSPGPGQTLDPNKVNVEYLPGGNPPPQQIYRVTDASQCTSGTGQGGWYFDNNAAPTKIILCPDTCTAVQADPAAKIDVKFGCESVFKPPA